jgi:DHA1 family bicyclomycin/chloramphenicol resistance-like MFS transporter
LAVFYGWQAVFFFLGTVSMLVGLVLLFMVDESLVTKDKNALHPRYILRNYVSLLKHPEYMAYSLSGGLCFAGLFAYLSGSPLVLIEVFGVAADHFGYFFGATVIGFMSGTLVGPILTHRGGGLVFALRVGTLFSAFGGLSMLVLALLSVDHVAAIVIPMTVYAFGMGIVLPQSQAGAMAPFPEKAGAASALMGFLMLGFAALLGYLIALLYNETQMAMVWAIAVMGVSCAIVFWTTARPSSEY